MKTPRRRTRFNGISSLAAAPWPAATPPNGRRHYDLDHPRPVRSTIKDGRVGSGPDGRDAIQLWTHERFAMYREMAPDCMGPWLVYWRQNMPGLDSRPRTTSGGR